MVHEWKQNTKKISADQKHTKIIAPIKYLDAIAI